MTNKHVHQYIRVQKAKRKDAVIWYTCIAVGCTHKERIEFMENRLSICNRCNDEFILTRKKLYDKPRMKPHCDACTKSVKQSTINELARMFQE